MRKRGFVPETWHDRKTLRWSHELLLFFLGLFSVVDDRGRAHLDTREIAAKLCRWREHQVEKHIADLVEWKVVETYGRMEGSEEPAYLHLVNFNRHQYISKPQPSKLPPGPSEQPRLAFDGESNPNIQTLRDIEKGT